VNGVLPDVSPKIILGFGFGFGYNTQTHTHTQNPIVGNTVLPTIAPAT